jgi:hypothetical protein
MALAKVFFIFMTLTISSILSRWGQSSQETGSIEVVLGRLSLIILSLTHYTVTISFKT